MDFLQPLLFAIITFVSILVATRSARKIIRNIRLGMPVEINGNARTRWKNVFLLAFGQQKMFRKPGVAILHLIVYVGFIIINIEIIEIILDGVTGKHRLLAPYLGSMYSPLINSFELLAVLVIVACVFFLLRRIVIPVKRLQSPELKGWPQKDALFILVTEIVLMSLFLLMNASDTLLQSRSIAPYHSHLTGSFFFSSFLHPFFESTPSSTLIMLERSAWWMHILGIYGFLNYLPISKHLHIILAFPNAYFKPLEPVGKMENMPAIQQEVLYAMQPELASASEASTPARFGAKDVQDLSWKNLLDAYSCTECGRCSSACPAQQTGKKLSPRKIMMDTRDRLEEVGRAMDKNGEWKDDGRSLLHHYITIEEINACTTCNACVQECPVSISPLDIILQLRRNLVMEESNTPAEWASLFGNVENNFAPWKFSPSDRENWTHQS